MTQNRHPSVDRLLAAIRKSGEFPAMAKTVGLISSLTSSEATSSGALADTILQHYGLTQKVKSVGLFYVDGEKAGLAALTPAVLNYLEVLRGQAILAIRQKAGRASGRR